jgi:hypothetical protein
MSLFFSNHFVITPNCFLFDSFLSFFCLRYDAPEDRLRTRFILKIKPLAYCMTLFASKNSLQFVKNEMPKQDKTLLQRPAVHGHICVAGSASAGVVRAPHILTTILTLTLSKFYNESTSPSR